MTIESFIEKNASMYIKTFHTKKEEKKSTLSVISKFLFEPKFEVENFTIKKIS